MLTRVGGTSEYRYDSKTAAVVRIGDAKERPLFPWRLEYNCPVHENWNIVHTGMLLPETQQIYVCSDNCLRGVILTAAEMGALSRISSVMPDENEVVNGRLEEVTIEGVADVIEKLPVRPKAVELFLVCMHHQTGADFRYIYDTLGNRFPDIAFVPCFMDPIMQKVSLTPEQKQRKSMMDLLTASHFENNMISVLGDNLRLPASADISRVLAVAGFTIRQIQDCKTFEDYLSMGNAGLYITRSALSVYGLKAAAEKNGRMELYLPPTAGDAEIDAALFSLQEALGICGMGGDLQKSGQTAKKLPPSVSQSNEKSARAVDLTGFLSSEKRKTEQAFAAARDTVGGRDVELDYLAFSRPLSFARRLLQEGFRVTRVYLDSISPEEHEDFLWLQEKYPDLLLQSTNSTLVRKQENLDRPERENVLALGPKAAFFADTPYFVNWIENDGNWGYDGLQRLCAAMIAAVKKPKNPEEIVQKKGLGWPSLVEDFPEKTEQRRRLFPTEEKEPIAHSGRAKGGAS